MSETLTASVETLIADESPCPAPRVIGMIGGKWKLLILQILIFQGTKRFGELRKSIDGITQTMLTNQLRALVENRVSKKVRKRMSRHSAVQSFLSLPTLRLQRMSPLTGALQHR